MVCRGDDVGTSAHLYDIETEAVAMLHYDGAMHLVTVSLNSMLYIHEVAQEGNWTCQSQVKLPSEGATKVVWATPGTLAVCNEKDPSCAVRMFNLTNGVNYALTPPQHGDGGGDPSGRRLTCAAYNAGTAVLACGQKDGHVTMFRFLGLPQSTKPGEEEPAPEDAWQTMAGVDVMGRLTQIAWGPQMRLLGALGSDGVRVCKKVRMHDKVRDGNSVVQVAADRVMVEAVDGSRPPTALQLNMQITGVDATDKHLLVWNSQTAEVHEAGPRGYVPISTFDSASDAMAIHRETVFRAGASMVEVCTLAGVVKDTLVYDDAHGQVEHMDVSKDYLAVSTSNGFIKLWRLGGRTPKSHGPTGGKKVDVRDIPTGSSIESIKVNCNGTKVSVLFVLPGSATTHTVLVVYDVDADCFRSFDFAQTGRVPEAHAWDHDVPMMFGVQTVTGGQLEASADVAGAPAASVKVSRSASGDRGDGGAPTTMSPGDGTEDRNSGIDTKNARKEANTPGLVVFTMFASPERIVLQESHPIPAGFEALLGLSVPSLYVCKKAAVAEGGGVCFSVTMRDFLGMEQVDPATKSALLEFNLHLATGNVEEAFRAVKSIKNPEVWENMAHMCIKSKRLDVAEMCLGNMGHVRGARAVRDASREPELDARVATVAVHLGLSP